MFPTMTAPLDTIDPFTRRIHLRLEDIAAPQRLTGIVPGRAVEVLAALEQTDLLGTVTLVAPSSPARRLAAPEEFELHLLCVRPDARGRGIGEALVRAALQRARAHGARGVVLWTQPSMETAQRLYLRCGFERDASADFNRGARQFLVHRYVFTTAP